MFPQDVFEELIFPTLTVGQMATLRQVSRDFKAAVDDSKLWKNIYCEQFDAPPAMPHTSAAGAFLRRCKARLLRTAVTEPEISMAVGCDLEEIEPDLKKDWTANVSVLGLRSVFDFKCTDLTRPPEDEEDGEQDGERAGEQNDQQNGQQEHQEDNGDDGEEGEEEYEKDYSGHEHLLPWLNIKKVRMLPCVCVALTLEGEIWVSGQKGYPQVCTQVYPPKYGGRFIDVQIEGDTTLDRVVALDEQGIISIWNAGDSGPANMSWSQTITGLDCTKFDMGCSPISLVYLSDHMLYARCKRGTQRISDEKVKNFACMYVPNGCRVVMLMEGGTIAHTILSLSNQQGVVLTQSTSPRLSTIENLVQRDDSLHSIAAHSGMGEINNRVWVLTEKGRLIECCFGEKGPFANVYRGLEGIVSISLGVAYRDNYAHHWDGSVYWLGDKYTFTPFKIESDPCIFRYLQRGSKSAQFVGMTALYV